MCDEYAGKVMGRKTQSQDKRATSIILNFWTQFSHMNTRKFFLFGQSHFFFLHKSTGNKNFYV